MLKTIKTTKHMRLDELIKHCIDNDIEDTTYSIGEISLMSKGFIVISNPNYKSVRVSDSGNFKIAGYVNKVDLFPVEIEEEITEETKFDLLVEVYFYDGEYHLQEFRNSSIGYIKDSDTCSIHAVINGKLQLIWERED